MEEKTLKERLLHIFIISIFCSLYFLVATISMINSVAFFDLSHSGLMSWSLAIGFEIGAAASLAAIIILDKTNKTMVWGLFLLLTSFQMMANSFHAFINLENYMGWIELFGLEEAEPIYQKRILSIVSGAILPVVALGFIKSLVDYIRPEQPEELQPSPTDEGPYTFETDKEIIPEEVVTEEEKLPVVVEEQLEKDSYSRDAITAKPPVIVGEVHIAPETVNTDNAVADKVAEPIPTEQTTPVGDPIIIPTDSAPLNTPMKAPLVSRPFIRSVESKP
jgi:hypothetical protein|tara:strand:- start:252 stop:1082 length:831 start_codon:yes stop_codon:yes gene_type:complete